MFFTPLNNEFYPTFESSLTFPFLSGFNNLTFGCPISKLLNLSVVDIKILFDFVLSFSAAVNALVEAALFPSIERSNFFFVTF